MDPRINIEINNLDAQDFLNRLSLYLNKRFNKMLDIQFKNNEILIQYKKEEYHLELLIFIQPKNISFYSHLWKIDGNDITGFGSFLQHLISAWVYSEYQLEKPFPSGLNLNHFKFKNYHCWRKYILKGRSFWYKLSVKLYRHVPKELFYL
jgi:hypothetical protein